ncbi:MAG: class II fructose-bisphosphate aldolase [Candidatus Harrisonbacteria bacterium]|nr:class II fructose-bisphosphate aldolase [Candidatus Harrisonbacteria bacterium]
MPSSFKEILAVSATHRVALGHFNVAELSIFKAVLRASKDIDVPVIIGVSESEREFFGFQNIVSLIKIARDSGSRVFLNADHTKHPEAALLAARAGFDAILMDLGHLPLEENAKQTKKIVEEIKSINPNILVEGELGYIGSGSQLLHTLPEGAALTENSLTTKEEAEQFVRETKIDLLAPAVGNLHGIYVDGKHPALNINRIREIKSVVNIPLVLHGASGNTDADIRAAITAGMNIVHVSTEVRLAWRRALDESLKTHPEELAPYKLLAPAEIAAYNIISRKLHLFIRN